MSWVLIGLALAAFVAAVGLCVRVVVDCIRDSRAAGEDT